MNHIYSIKLCKFVLFIGLFQQVLYLLDLNFRNSYLVVVLELLQTTVIVSTSYEVNGQACPPEPAGPAHSVDVGLEVCFSYSFVTFRHVEVYYQCYFGIIDSSG